MDYRSKKNINFISHPAGHWFSAVRSGSLMSVSCQISDCRHVTDGLMSGYGKTQNDSCIIYTPADTKAVFSEYCIVAQELASILIQWQGKIRSCCEESSTYPIPKHVQSDFPTLLNLTFNYHSGVHPKTSWIKPTWMRWFTRAKSAEESRRERGRERERLVKRCGLV